MAKVTVLKMRSFTKWGHTLTKGLNEDVPPTLARSLMGDDRFSVEITADDDKVTIRKDDDNGPPKDRKERLSLIAGAIAKLDPDNEDHYTNAGKPDARALTSVLGWQVTSNDRDAAMAEMQKNAIVPAEIEDEEEADADEEGADETPAAEQVEGTETDTKGKVVFKKKADGSPEPETDPTTKKAVEV